MALNGMAFADRVRLMRANGDLDDTVTDADLLAECDRQLIGRAADVPPTGPSSTSSGAHTGSAAGAGDGQHQPRRHGRARRDRAGGAVFDAVVTRDDVACPSWTSGRWCGAGFRVEELRQPCHRSPVDPADEHERTMDPSRSTGVHIGHRTLTSPPAGEYPR
jgi:hypothetical protein